VSELKRGNITATKYIGTYHSKSLFGVGACCIVLAVFAFLFYF
jgi:hypothetical protein